MLTQPRRLAASILLGVLALTAVAATEDDPIRTAAELPLAVLQDALPVDAAAAGLDFAPMLLSVTAPTQADRSALSNAGFDVTEHAGDDFLEVVVTSQEQLDLLDELRYQYEVVIADMIARETERILADNAFTTANASTDLPSGRTTYRVLADFVEEIDALVAEHPAIARKVVVGQSVEGRDILGIEVGADVNAPEDGRPVLLMFGNHHAREWPSAETPMEFAYDLLRGHAAGDERTVDLLERARAIIVPVSNPDGFDASRTSGDLIDLNSFNDQDPLGGTTVILATPGNAYKRKNCSYYVGQPAPGPTCLLTPSPGGYGIGVDLNRNYGALWGGPGAVGELPEAEEGVDISNTGVTSPIYQGPAPFSEPETQAIRTLISTRQVTTLISNHTFSNLLLRPVGVQPTTEHPDGFPIGFAPDECFETDAGDDLGMQALGELMTAQTGYSNQFGWELYDTTGTTEDYSYNATGGYGYTFEIGPDEFHPPFEDVVGEYVGTAGAAQAVTPGNASDLTSSAGRDCEGDPVAHDTVGGGLREAYYIALENAADSRTHSVITGEAPAGAEIAVTRTGTFPLWDGTPVEDTVSTAMTVDEDGTFDYHVNPSTRPFADARSYLDPDAPEPERRELRTVATNPEGDNPSNETGDPPAQDESEDFLVPIDASEGIESVHVTLTNATVPTDDYDIQLLSPDAVVLGESANLPGETESIRFDRPGTGGINPGTYVVRVTNYAALGDYDLMVSLGDFPDYAPPAELETPRRTEAWTVTCTVDGEELAREDVVVDRGEAVDLGEFCVLAASVEPPAAAPDPDLAATGGGAALLAVLALGGAVALARRRRED